MATNNNNKQNRLLTIRNLCEIFGCSRPTIWRMRAAGSLPNPVYLNAKKPRWRSDEIDQLISSNQRADHAADMNTHI